jgi:ribosomal protein S18 acetylase RimI-like enzyme
MTHFDITLTDDFQIRYTEASDEEFLKKWLLEPSTMHWFSVCDKEEVDDLVKIWISYSRFKCSLTATYKGNPCGIATLFLMPYVKLIHQSMVYLIVDPQMQRKKIGTALVRNLDHLAASYFKLERMHYEVFGKNPLIDLLKKQGYQQQFMQEKYVKEVNQYFCRTLLEKVLKS